MTRNLRNLHERLGQAIDDPNLAQGHLLKAVKGVLGLAGDRAVTMGRGNPVGAMYPMQKLPPPKPAEKSVPVAKPVVKPVQPVPKPKKRPSP